MIDEAFEKWWKRINTEFPDMFGKTEEASMYIAFKAGVAEMNNESDKLTKSLDDVILERNLLKEELRLLKMSVEEIYHTFIASDVEETE